MDTLDKILSLLKNEGVEQQKFAEAIGIKDYVISEWKKKKTKSYMKHIDKIADFFGVSVDYLVKDEEITLSGWLEQIIYKLSKELNQPRERLIGFLLDYQKKVSNLAKYEEEFTADEEQLRAIFTDYLHQEKATPQEQPLTDKQEKVLSLAKNLSDEDMKKLIDYAELLAKAKNQ